MPQTTLSKNLTNLRLSNQLSEDEITRISGKSWISWCKYENGDAKPPKTVLERLSTYFKIPVDELVGDTPLPKRKSPTKKPAAAPAKSSVKTQAPVKKAAPVKEEPPVSQEAPVKQEASKSQESPMEVYIQATGGGEISLENLYKILKEQAPNAENVYVKPEENKAYWTAPRGQKGIIQLY